MKTYKCSLGDLREYDVYLTWGGYENGRAALRLLCVSDRSPFATATVNLPDEPLEPGETAIKDYAENVGMLAFLVNNCLVEAPHRMTDSGHVFIPICRWTEAAKQSMVEFWDS